MSARSAFPLAPRLKRLATIFRSHGSAFVRDDRGAATIEVALTSLFMVYSVMNVTDLSIYAYARMQVQNAAQMGAQAAYETCGSNDVPATSKCTGLSAAVTRGV